MRRLYWSVFSVPACFLARYSWARICGGRGKRGVRGSRGSAELTRSPSNERVKRFRAESHLVQGGVLVPVANLALAPVAHPARHLLGSEVLHGGAARRVRRAHARREVDGRSFTFRSLRFVPLHWNRHHFGLRGAVARTSISHFPLENVDFPRRFSCRWWARQSGAREGEACEASGVLPSYAPPWLTQARRST